MKFLARFVPWIILACGAYVFLASLYEIHHDLCGPNAYHRDEYCTAARVISGGWRGTRETIAQNADVIIAVFTIFLAFFTKALVDSTNKLWDETRKAGDIARETLDATNRPWLEVVAEPIDDFKVLEGKAHLSVKIKVTNVGKSPAIAIKCGIMLPTSKHLGGRLSAQLKEIATSKEFEDERGDTAFPGNFIARKMKPQLAMPEDWLEYFVIWVGYMFTFGGIEDERVRFTALMVEIRREDLVDGRKLVHTPVKELPNGLTIPRSALRLHETGRFIN